MGDYPTVVRPEYKTRQDGTTMKALAWFGPRDVRVIEAPVPDISEPDDVILRVTGTTICGSDLHLYNGEIVNLQKGDILGHEVRSSALMGMQGACSSSSSSWALSTLSAPTSRTFKSANVSSPRSRSLAETANTASRNSRPSVIVQTHRRESPHEPAWKDFDSPLLNRLQNAMYGHRDAGFFGYSHFTGGFPGGQAEYVRVPKGNVNLLPIPEGVADERALYLSDVLPTSYHAVFDTGVTQGDVVGVWVSR